MVSLGPRRSLPPGAGLLPLTGVVLLALAAASCGDSSDLPATVEYNRDVRPILSNRCFACHGPDSNARKAGLRLDVRESAVANRDGYDRPAIVPGNPGRSELIRRVQADDPEERMPPPKSNQAGYEGRRLSDRETAVLTRWVKQGAEWQEHWSYRPVTRPPLPRVKSGAEVENPIDRFVLAELEKRGLEPAEPADRHTLIRRAGLDLTGLPPSPEELDRFLADDSPSAYEQLIDRLLASPHYGETMAIEWLDLVRYADTNGYHSDVHRRIWPYRDYVINAFNQNKPFDQFTREQLAGDLLPDATREQQVASGFNRLGQITKEGGAQPKEYLARYAADRVRAVGTTWLGSTVGCAECHDHKFDPYSMEDFYRLAAFFADVQEKGVFENDSDVFPELPLTSTDPATAAAQRREYGRLEREILTLRRAHSSSKAERERNQQRLRRAEAEFDRLNREAPRTLVTVAVEPHPVRVLARGDWQDNRGRIVQAAPPEFLSDPPADSHRLSRLDLADWLVSKENPLTARVYVNRLWRQFFGRGLSATPGDVGSQGKWPSHPELLDWLAAEFMESGWDIRHMVRLMVTSRTYRQASMASPRTLELDPDNQYFSRQNRFRVRAEIVRDIILSSSGLLSARVGGPSVQPYQPEGYWKEINTFGVEGPGSTWENAPGEDQYRRGLYTYWKRTFLHPSMVAFDAPDRQECTADRPVSNTPLQALALLNDPSYVEAARVLAEQAMRLPEPGFRERIDWVFRRGLSRPVRQEESETLEALFRGQLARYRQDPAAAVEFTSVGQHPVPEETDRVELAAWTATMRAVLNLNELITRY